MRHHRLARAVVLVAGVAGAATLVAQQESVDRAVVARIQTEATQRSKVLETFNYITNVTGGRLTGSRAHKQAADYLRDRLAEWGMTNPHLEPFPFDRGGWELQKFTLELMAPRYFPMYGFPAAWSTSTKGVLEGTPIYIGDQTSAEIEALGEKLRGAIVLMTPPQTVFTSVDRLDPTVSGQPAGAMPPSSGPAPRQAQPRAPANEISTLLRRFGAGAVLRPSAGKDDTIFIGAATAGQDAVPQVTVVTEHYNMIVRMMQTGVTPRLRLEVRAVFEPADKISYNVIADIPGEDPVLKNEIVLLGAHLDSWHAATGATDNADGVAAASEAMRILKVLGVHPRRTIRLAIWSGEEVGFLGGKAYVDQHLKDQASRDAIAVYLNDDPGTGATVGWFMANNDASKKILDSWVDQLKDLGMRKNTMDAYFSSEDGVFDAVGVPAFTTIQDYTNYDVRLHHTNTDFYEAISEKDLEQSATVLATFAYQAAMRNEKFPRRPPGVPANPNAPPGRGGRGAAPAGAAPAGRGGQ
jgi:carboxypeptidase Q